MGISTPDGKTPSSTTFAELHETLQRSSDRNARHLTMFILLLVYILITVAATSDVKFLLPDSGVSLPVLNVQLPLVGFFIVAPALIVILHFNLLLNLLHHARKLKAWDDAVGDKKILLPGFILNYGLMFEEKKTTNYWLMRSLQIILLCFSPLALLLFVQIRYAANHDVWMTAWHFVLVTLDVAVLMIFWFRIIYPDLLDTPYDSIKALFSFSPNRSELQPAVSQSVRPWGRRFRAAMNWIVQGCSIPAGTLWRFAKPARPIAPAYMPIFLTVFLISLGCAVIIVQVDRGVFKEHYFLVPRLDVAGETLVKKLPSDEIVESYRVRGKTKEEAWADYAEGITISPGRDLQFAVMTNCNLSNSTLNGVRLNGATLDGANLERDSLCSAELNRAFLRSARLNGAFLDSARLNGAMLWEAELNRASLKSAELNGAGLFWAELNGANLSYAKLNGADLAEAELNGARLTEAELNCADLESSKLNGALLSLADLNGAGLIGAELNGADLYGAELNGAGLIGAELNGADLESAQLNGALLIDARLNAAYLESVLFRGSRGIDTLHAKSMFISGGIDTLNLVNYDLLKADSIKIFVGPMREAFLSRVDTAEAYSNFVDPALAGLRHDSAGFVEFRKKLACGNAWTAAGLLAQDVGNLAFKAHLNQSILGYLATHCRDSLPIIRDRVRYQYVRSVIDSVLQALPEK